MMDHSSKFEPGHPLRRFEPRFEFYRIEHLDGKEVHWWKERATGMIVDTHDADTVTRFIDARIERTSIGAEHVTTSVVTEVEKVYDAARLRWPGSRFWDELTGEEREWFVFFYAECLRRNSGG